MSSPHSALLIGLGLDKKPNNSLPPSTRPSPSMPSAKPQMPGQQQSQPGAKASQDDAGYVDADNVCGGCKNFTKESGDCSKVEGPVTAGSGCRKYFEAANGMGSDMDNLMGSAPPQADPLAAMGAK